MLTGKATAYTGAAVGGAKVKWRVERDVQLPYWCWWWIAPPSKAISHGSAVTEADGTFKIDFAAEADRAVSAANEPVFEFSVHADVTDTTGETRSDDRAVWAGYTALRASLAAGEWQTPDKPVEFTVEANSLDGDPQPADGTLTICALKQPAAVERAPLQRERFWWSFNAGEPKSDPTNPDSWEPGEAVAERAFTTDATGKTQVAAPLKAGIYRASLETKDRFGKKVTARMTVQVVDPREPHYGVKLPNHFASPKWSVEPGEKLSALWGTGYDTGRAFVELECDGQPLKSYWTASNRTQELIEQPVTEEMRGGLTLRVTYVRENRAYFNEHVVAVPWSNKQLTVKWESFRSKLLPGQKETWTAVVTGPDATRTAAEMVATLYDASLDQYLPHSWPQSFSVFRHEKDRVYAEFENGRFNFQNVQSWSQPQPSPVYWDYRAFPPDIIANLWGYGYLPAPGAARLSEEVVALSPFVVDASEDRISYKATSTLAGGKYGSRAEVEELAKYKLGFSDQEDASAPAPKPDLTKVAARKNLNETAFFFPQLLADDNGVVKMTFTMPEALTEWRFLGFAHDNKLRAGFLSDKVVTTKDLIVEPNPPRFVREGDAIEFTVKVSNQTDQPQAGTVRLTFADAATLQPVDDALGNRVTEQPFDLPAKQSRSYFWRIAVPDGLGFITYKAVGATAQASDGEEGFLPVLSRRILVTESLPLPVRGKTTKRIRVQEAPRLRQIRHAAQPVADGTNGVAARVVCGDVAAVPDGVPVRMQRADLQPALRQRARPPRRQFRPEDPPHLRSLEGHAGARQSAGEEPGPEVGDAGGNAVAPPGDG